MKQLNGILIVKCRSAATAKRLLRRSASLKLSRAPRNDIVTVIASVAKQSHRKGSMALWLLLLLMLSAAPLAAHPAFNIRRGLSALANGDLEQAETELQRARFAEPDNPVVSYNLGVVSYRRRDYQKAAGFFTQSATAAGTDEQMKFASLYNLGNTAFKAGDYAVAVSAYNSSLEVRDDPQARYNLEVASKKLQEQQEKQQQQEQQNKDQQQNQPQKDGQKQQQDGQQDKSDQQQQQNKQSGDQQQADSQSGSEDQQDDSEKQQQADSSDQQQNEESDQQQTQKPKSGNEEQNASQSSPLNEQSAEDPSARREDVQMGNAGEPQKKQKPEASQRARALKNAKLNPYQVERLLQQMQERERQAQLHYRNEPQRMDEEDPFNMDARQLQEWMQNRGRRRQQQPADEPDW